MIAGEHAQAAGVNRQRFVQAELGREIGDQHLALVGVMLLEPAVLLEVVLERRVNALQVGEIPVILRGVGELGLGDRPSSLTGL